MQIPTKWEQETSLQASAPEFTLQPDSHNYKQEQHPAVGSYVFAVRVKSAQVC